MSQPAQQQPQMSQEELDRRMNRFKADPSLVAGMRSSDDQVFTQALEQFAQRVAREAVTAAHLQTQALQHTFEGRFKPVEQQTSYLTQQAYMKQFLRQYPDLKNHRALVDATLGQMKDEQGLPEKDDEFFKVLATSTESLIKQVNPEFRLSDESNPGTPPVTSPGAPTPPVTPPQRQNPTPVSLTPSGGTPPTPKGTTPGTPESGPNIWD